MFEVNGRMEAPHHLAPPLPTKGKDPATKLDEFLEKFQTAIDSPPPPLIATIANRNIRKAIQRYNTKQRWKRQVCILFVGAARFLYRTLCRCRSARSMHAPEKSDILKQVYNPCSHYFDSYYHFVRQKDCLLTHTPHTFDMDS